MQLRVTSGDSAELTLNSSAVLQPTLALAHVSLAYYEYHHNAMLDFYISLFFFCFKSINRIPGFEQ